jgi:purine-binding chemotaxis protein CheW
MISNNSTQEMLVTCFTLGDASFGVDARTVLEVVKVGELTPVHGAPQSVAGIRNLRGRIVTVIDMASHLQLGEVTPCSNTRLLIMEHHGESYGFLVDSVTESIETNLNSLEEIPESINSNLRTNLLGICHNVSKLTAVLNHTALFNWENE